MRNDEQLIRSLGAALAPDARSPADDRVDALRTHMLASPGPRPRGARRVAIALALLAALAAGTVIGHELPRPARQVAIWLQIPVESFDLVDARAQLDRLGRALADRDAEEAIAADRAMLGFVRKLDQKEKDEIVPVAHEVHVRACAFLAGLGVPPIETCTGG